MASSAAALKTAAATVAVFAVLVISSQGNPRTGPPCSSCGSQCNSTCGTVTATNCSSACGYPPECYNCLDRVYNGYESCCGNATINSGVSCCDNGCLGDCYEKCGPCDVNGLMTVRCRDVCKLNSTACEACEETVSRQCNASCNKDCSKTCVKKDSNNGW
jgi:hypothetical protein